MGDDNLIGRVMVLENIVRYTMPRIEQYMKDGVELRVEGTEKLAKVEAAIIDFSKYQDHCDQDRESIKVSIKKVENYQLKQKAQATILTTIAATVGSGVTMAVENYTWVKETLHKLFTS